MCTTKAEVGINLNSDKFIILSNDSTVGSNDANSKSNIFNYKQCGR